MGSLQSLGQRRWAHSEVEAPLSEGERVILLSTHCVQEDCLRREEGEREEGGRVEK